MYYVSSLAAPLTAATRSTDRLTPEGTFVRARTRVEWDDNDVDLVAGVHARLMSRGGDDSVDLGGTPEDEPEHHATLAEPLATAFNANRVALDGLIDAVNQIRVIIGLDPYVETTSGFPSAATSRVVRVK